MNLLLSYLENFSKPAVKEDLAEVKQLAKEKGKFARMMTWLSAFQEEELNNQVLSVFPENEGNPLMCSPKGLLKIIL